MSAARPEVLPRAGGRPAHQGACESAGLRACGPAGLRGGAVAGVRLLGLGVLELFFPSFISFIVLFSSSFFLGGGWGFGVVWRDCSGQ